MASSSTQTSPPVASKVIILEAGMSFQVRTKRRSPRRAMNSGSSTEPDSEGVGLRTRAFYRAHKLAVPKSSTTELSTRRKLSRITNVDSRAVNITDTCAEAATRPIKPLPSRRRQGQAEPSTTATVQLQLMASPPPHSPEQPKLRRSARFNASASASHTPALIPAPIPSIPSLPSSTTIPTTATPPYSPPRPCLPSLGLTEHVRGKPRWEQEVERVKAIFPEYPSNPQPWPSLHPHHAREIELREAHRVSMEAEKLYEQPSSVILDTTNSKNIPPPFSPNSPCSSIPLRHRKLLGRMNPGFIIVPMELSAVIPRVRRAYEHALRIPPSPYLRH